MSRLITLSSVLLIVLAVGVVTRLGPDSQLAPSWLERRTGGTLRLTTPVVAYSAHEIDPVEAMVFELRAQLVAVETEVIYALRIRGMKAAVFPVEISERNRPGVV